MLFQGIGGLGGAMLPMILIFGVFYLLLIRPQQKKQRQLQATIAELKSTVSQQQKSFAQHEAQIQALASGLRNVSAQVEISKPTPKVVVNTP